jgi:hypothetical protein
MSPQDRAAAPGIDVRALSIRVSRPPALAFPLTTSSETERGDRR